MDDEVEKVVEGLLVNVVPERLFLLDSMVFLECQRLQCFLRGEIECSEEDIDQCAEKIQKKDRERRDTAYNYTSNLPLLAK